MSFLDFFNITLSDEERMCVLCCAVIMFYTCSICSGLKDRDVIHAKLTTTQPVKFCTIVSMLT